MRSKKIAHPKGGAKDRRVYLGEFWVNSRGAAPCTPNKSCPRRGQPLDANFVASIRPISTCPNTKTWAAPKRITPSPLHQNCLTCKIRISKHKTACQSKGRHGIKVPPRLTPHQTSPSTPQETPGAALKVWGPLPHTTNFWTLQTSEPVFSRFEHTHGTGHRVSTSAPPTEIFGVGVSQACPLQQ